MKSKIFILFSLVIGLVAMTSCEVEEVFDQDNPTLGSVTSNASKSQLQFLVTGLEARHRGYFGGAHTLFGNFGRETWNYNSSDPRSISDVLGITIADTYPDFFGSAGTYLTAYQAVRQAEVLIAAAENSSFVSDQEENGITGFAKTIKAYQLIWPWLQQWDNGVRVDVAEVLNPGPILPRAEALDAIRAVLEDGYNDLKAAGSTFSFNLTTGFNGFNTPAGMIKVNRAIAARLALYDEDWSGALTALNESFLNLNATTPADMNVGPTHVYGEAPDVNNPLYNPFDRATSSILIAHPDWIEDALPGDQRVATKVQKRLLNPVQNNGLRDAAGDLLIGEYQDARWATNTTPIPYLRNEELMLIYAEAKVRTNASADAVTTINKIRNTWGVGNYDGATDANALIDEILFQRRYSLWGEVGHRWIDLRRTDRLNSTYIDLRDRGKIFKQVARPTAETNWEER
ncbi:MAG: RagB/SusD family nutrient uptake outer membrane protein [Saprospiraceae bacterium]|nr:RagB/SusD family nutrient uptake outer membrane protein [Saprospiraceae bacterium]